MTRHYPRVAPEIRFWQKVEKTDTCWNWNSAISPNGYGNLWTPTGTHHLSAHRFSFELHFGAIPDGFIVCHKCDNRKCVRPDHLFLGTTADNVHDAMSKGRGADGERRHNAKLTELLVREIRTRHAEGIPNRQLAQEYGVTKHTIKAIMCRRLWKHVT